MHTYRWIMVYPNYLWLTWVLMANSGIYICHKATIIWFKYVFQKRCKHAASAHCRCMFWGRGRRLLIEINPKKLKFLRKTLLLHHLNHAELNREPLLAKLSMNGGSFQHVLLSRSKGIINWHIFQGSAVPSEWGSAETNVNNTPRGLVKPFKKRVCALCVVSIFPVNKHKITVSEKVLSLAGVAPLLTVQVLTHQRTEGDDGQQSLDQDAEPVRQSSVIAAVRIRLVDVGHVGDLEHLIVQESFHQEDPAVPVHVHVDTIKTRETKGAPWVGWEGLNR